MNAPSVARSKSQSKMRKKEEDEDYVFEDEDDKEDEDEGDEDEGEDERDKDGEDKDGDVEDEDDNRLGNPDTLDMPVDQDDPDEADIHHETVSFNIDVTSEEILKMVEGAIPALISSRMRKLYRTIPTHLAQSLVFRIPKRSRDPTTWPAVVPDVDLLWKHAVDGKRTLDIGVIPDWFNMEDHALQIQWLARGYIVIRFLLSDSGPRRQGAQPIWYG